MKKILFFNFGKGFLFFLMIVQGDPLKAQLNSNFPNVQWRRFDWVVNTPPFKDDDGNNHPSIRVERDESGSDWWYDLKPSFEGGIQSTGNHNGFITCGYSSINNNNGLEFGQNCYQQPEPPLDCNEVFTNGGPLPLPGNVHNSNTPFFHTIAKFKPNGFSQEWMQVTPHKGNAYRVIQLNDGSYVTVGDSYSIADFNGNSLNYNGGFGFNCPNGSSLPTSQEGYRTTSFVGVSKVSAQGEQLWNNLYGVLPNAVDYISTPENAVTNYVHEAWDAVQMPGLNGNIFVVGRQMGFAYIWEIDVNGSLISGINLHELLTGPLNSIGLPPGFTRISNSTIKSVAFDPTSTNHDLILGIKVGLDKSETQLWDSYSYNRVLFVKCNKIQGITGYGWPLIEPTYSEITDEYGLNLFNQQNIYSLIRTPDGKFLAGMATQCRECDAATGNAKGTITVTRFGGNQLTPNGMSAPEIKYFGIGQSFDFRVGVCNNIFSNDNGFGLISSKKSPNESYQPASCACPLSPNIGLNIGGYFNTDSYMASLDQNLNTVWESTYMDEDAPTPSTCYPGNYKKQECTYTIAQAPDGGYIGGGNQSNNLDDSYLYKVFPQNCSSSLEYDIVNNTPPNSIIPIPFYKFPQPQPFPGYQEVLWNQSKTVKGTVVVDPGICLRIKGSNTVISFEVDRAYPNDPALSMPSRIIVRPGGKLILDGATLNAKSDCTSGMWGGIEVWGISPGGTQPDQTTFLQEVAPGVFERFSSQGMFVAMNNATIKNAFKGVTTVPMKMGAKAYELNQIEYNDMFGGLVKMSNTTVQDCRFGVDLGGYFSQDASTIDNCQFLSTGPLNAPGTGDAMVCADEPEEAYTEVHCSLRGVRGVRLAGNAYKCIDPTVSFFGTGVRGLNAGFTAAEFGFGAAIPKPSVFNNLMHGVRAGDMGASSITIRQNKFTDVLRPISLETTIGSQVNRNTVQYTKPTLGSIGIYTKGAQGYWVRGNSLTGPPNAGLYQAGWSHGFLSENQDIINSILKSNEFKGFWCQNRFDMTNQNLYTNCNQSHQDLGLSEYTWLITGTAQLPGRLNNQKSNDLNLPGLRNTFLAPNNNFLQIRCDGNAYSFNYYGTQDQANCLPTDVSPCVTVFGAGAIPCGLENYDEGISDIKIEEIRDNYSAARLAYDSLRSAIDDKRTALLEAGVSAGEYSTLDALPQASKNKLSDDVLLAMIRNLPPPDWAKFRDAMVQNSPLKPAVLDSFLLATIPLAIKEQVQTAQVGQSPRALLEEQLDSLEAIRVGILGEWAQLYLENDLADSALLVLSNDPAPAAFVYGLGLCLTYQKDPIPWLTKASAFADSLARIKKDSDELLTKWVSIKNQYEAILNPMVFGHQTDSSFWANQANLQTPMGIKANLAMEWAAGKPFHYDPNPFIEVSGYRYAASQEGGSSPNPSVIVSNPSNLFSLYPNPTEDAVTLNLPSTCQRVVVYNALGQSMGHYACTGQSTLQLSTQAWPNGLYWVQAFQANGASTTLKLQCQNAH